MSPRLPGFLTFVLSAISLLAFTAANAAADAVVNDDQIVTGQMCLGLGCVDGEVFNNPPLKIRSDDTPAIELTQNGNGFGAYRWDVGGNEANFFIRDTTNSSQLVFRAFPGAKSNTLRAEGNSTVGTYGVYVQHANFQQTVAPAATDSVLTNLANLTFESYLVDGDSSNTSHLRPKADEFAGMFGVSTSTQQSVNDVAAVSLAASKELQLLFNQQASNVTARLNSADAKINALESKNSALESRNSALETSNANLNRSIKRQTAQIKKIQKQIKMLARR